MCLFCNYRSSAIRVIDDNALPAEDFHRRKSHSRARACLSQRQIFAAEFSRDIRRRNHSRATQMLRRASS
jgi:hypothetical protein